MEIQWQNRFVKLFVQGGMLSSLFAIAVSIIIVIIILIPMGISPIEAFHYTIKDCFSSFYNFSEVFVEAVPLLLAGLGVAVAFRAGLFNIGIEGQILFGGLIAAYAGSRWNLPPIINLIVILIIGGLAGALWGLIPAFLRVEKGISEVVTTLMMYNISIYFTHYMVVNPWKAPGLMPATPYIKNSAVFPILLQGTRFHGGVIFAIVLAIFIYWILNKTKIGFEIRAVGLNPIAAKYAGINVNRILYLSLLSGAFLGGIAGIVEITGVYHRFFDQFSSGLGFDGIAVALVGGNNPIGIIFSAIFFGIIRTTNLQMAVSAGVPKYLSYLMEGIIVILIAFKNVYHEKIERLLHQ